MRLPRESVSRQERGKRRLPLLPQFVADAVLWGRASDV
jgi:hypothetical protein